MSGIEQYKLKTIKFRPDTEVQQEKILTDISLNLAVKLGIIESVKLLLKKGADINEPGKNKLTPLHVAVKHNRIIILKFLVENGAFVDALSIGPKSERFTPLYLAIEKNHLKCANILLEYGANISTNIIGIYNPIFYAVIKSRITMVALLLNYGADVNLRFDNNFFERNEPTFHRSWWQDQNLPLLHYSILERNRELRELLLDRGADVNLRTSLGKTTLMQAVEVGDMFAFDDFAEKENVNDRDNFGQPVLHFTVLNANRKASMYSKEENRRAHMRVFIMMKLLSVGADLYARFPDDQEHTTLIHYMIKFGCNEGVNTLLYFFSTNFNFNLINLKSVYLGRLATENLTPDIENDLEYINDLKQRFGDITYDIIKKAMILKMAGLPVDENLLLERPIHDWITQQEYTLRICSIREEIMEQINFMKGIKIGDSNFTLWHLVSCKMNELIKLMSIQAIRYFKCNRTQFQSLSYYYKILEERLSYAKYRNFLLEHSKETIFNIFINHLPYDCCEEIVNYLNNNDLEVLIRD